MRVLIDTNVAIHVRDGDPEIGKRVAALEAAPLISVLTRVELEGGIYRNSEIAELRRARLNVLVDMVSQLPFGTNEAEAYGRIVRECGYSRPRILDRMIAASAITNGLRLVTLNGDDFRSVPGLDLEVWPQPS